MSKCSACGRPVVSDPHILPNGQVVHDECRGAEFLPRARPSVIGTSQGIGPALRAFRGTRRHDSGIFAAEVPPVVLFIAADEDVLMAYQALARSASLDAEVARDGHEAVFLAQLARPDAIVIDLGDSRLDAGWIIRRLRNSASSKTIPIVVFAAVTSGRVERDGHRPADEPHAPDVRAVLQTLETIFRRPTKSAAMGG